MINPRFPLSPRKYLSLSFFFFILFSVSCSVKPVVFQSNKWEESPELSETQKMMWHHLDPQKDMVPGLSTERAYAELLKGKKGEPILVAVIDSGIDLGHEDLKDVLWTNVGELAGDGLDNDGNGYIDDIHGFNFLGDAYREQLEYTRIVKLQIGDEAYQQKARETLDREYEEVMESYNNFGQIMAFIKEADRTLQVALGKEDYNIDELLNLKTEDEETRQKAMVMVGMIEMVGSLKEIKNDIAQAEEFFESRLDYHLNLDFNGREIVGDDPYNFDDRSYGNGNPHIKVKAESHGTHVAGIIAADRANNLGIKGVADNVSIMAVRAVPDGDEYDKDIALAIRYAVDNGAKVINASFGKAFSPNAEWVYEALSYAAEKDVLFVHAAGNEGLNLDLSSNPNFPNDHKFINEPEFTDNVLTVGAITSNFGSDLLASFSNYGKLNVDIFAPGSDIYSTIPENEYDFQSGTSMAAPTVSGLAALIRSQYPELSAVQVKQIIMASGVDPVLPVTLGDDEEEQRLVSLKEISRTGKIANAFNALLMAEKVAKGKLKL